MIKPVDTTAREKERSGAIEEQTATFFGEDTPLRNAEKAGGRPYEPRPQQQAMARYTARVLENRGHLCVEAPTGVGKTFAYLVPAIYLAMAREEPVVVSTHTISLQEQIIDRDLPLLKKLMGAEISSAIAKGRRNYLCLRRLEAATGPHQEYLPQSELLPELERIRNWAASSREGSLSELSTEPDPEIWDVVCCEIGNCLGASCPHFSKCFYMRARQKLARSHIIVSNHALYFTDLAMKVEAEDDEAGVIPQYQAVVLDEGHR